MTDPKTLPKIDTVTVIDPKNGVPFDRDILRPVISEDAPIVMGTVYVVDIIIAHDSPCVVRSDINSTSINQRPENTRPELLRLTNLIALDNSGGTVDIFFSEVDSQSYCRIGKILKIIVLNPVIYTTTEDKGHIGHHPAVSDKPVLLDVGIATSFHDPDTTLVIAGKQTVLDTDVIRI